MNMTYSKYVGKINFYMTEKMKSKILLSFQAC